MTPRVKVFCIRLSAIGDIAMTVPVISAVLEQNPHVEIHYATPKFAHAFFPSHPRLFLIDFDKKKKYKGIKGLIKFYREYKSLSFNAFADLHNVLRSIILRNLFKLKTSSTSVLDKGRTEKRALTRKHNKKKVPLRPMTERYADVFRNLGLKVHLPHELHNFLFQPLSKINAIGIAPFAKHAEKMLPLEKTLEVALSIAEQGTKVYLFGSKNEAPLLHDFQHENIEIMAGKCSFKEELQLISQLQCMISMDSSNMHLASLVGVPVISIWGATHPYAGFLGYGQSMENVVQEKNLSCRPCSVFGNKKCYRKDLLCMKQICTKEIMLKLQPYLKPH